MTEPDNMDRFARGELDAAESRKLALESLRDPELFEELTSIALAKTAVDRQSSKVVRISGKPIVWIVAAAIAAVVILMISLASVKQPPQTTSSLTPALESAAKPGQPLLLASELDVQDDAPLFRGADPASRDPRSAGSIVSIEDGIASIDLGSVDGLGQGSEVRIVRDEKEVGRLVLETVFRDRARGRVSAAQRIGDQVRVADPTHVAALTERAVALNDLGVVQMLRRDYNAAEGPLTNAASTAPKTELAYGRAVNNLGVLAELRGDRENAKMLYTEALQVYSSVRNPTARERKAIETNLARAGEPR